MTPEQLTKAFTDAGFETAAQVTALLVKARPALALPEIDRQIEKLREEQQTLFQQKEAEIQTAQAEQARIREEQRALLG